MKPEQRSKTAEAAAAARAWHALTTNEPVFEDPFAIRLLSPINRWRVHSRWLRALQRWLFGDLGPMAIGQINIRSRYAEDALERAIEAGVTQYLILAAGFDTFALRRPDLSARVRIFEVDHPASQADKRARLRRIGQSSPANVEMVGVDFEREDLGTALGRMTIEPDTPTFVSWLGTVPYLSEAAIASTASALSRALAPGSELVFDFGGPVEHLDPRDRAALETLRRFTARRGEPLQTYGPVAPFLDRFHDLGFQTVELLTPEDQEQRYGPGIRTLPVAHLARLRLGAD